MTGQKQRSGGARPGAGRPRQYIYKKIRVNGTVERSESERLLPDHELEVQLAEMEEGGLRGVLLDDIWYDSQELMSLATFVRKHQEWLQG